MLLYYNRYLSFVKSPDQKVHLTIDIQQKEKKKKKVYKPIQYQSSNDVVFCQHRVS